MPRGRKTKLDADRIQRVVEGLSLAMSREGAARRAGLSTTAFYEYLQRAEADKTANRTTIYTEFADAVAEAEAKLEATLSGSWTVAARKDWKAGALLLARRFPEQWAPKADTTAVVVTVNGQATITNPGALEAARKLRDELAKGEAE
jgi:hypothetical protein